MVLSQGETRKGLIDLSFSMAKFVGSGVLFI